jgi:hypothetical protein
MAFRTRREQRYVTLRKAHLLPFEARPMSRVPMIQYKMVPYLAEALKVRQEMWKKAVEMKISVIKWEAQIKELYKVNGWLTKTRTGKIVADPWSMLRDYEDKWRAKYPQYESPWQKRQKNWRDFLPKAEKTIQKQQGLK